MPDSGSPSILIVGAGPTGLTAAIELARRGYRLRIIDGDSGPVRESRALAVNPRTLAILEPSGATERLLRSGTRLYGAQFHTAKRDLFRLDLAELGGPFPFILSLPQGDVQAVLVEILARLGIGVEWTTELRRLEEHGSGLNVELLQSEGATETLQPELVIGADGAHSKVRKSAGLEFSGSAYQSEWGLADVVIDADLPRDRVHAFDLAPVLFALIPIRWPLVRVITDQPDVLNHVPPRIRVNEVHWQTTFRISHRQVDTYQKGPVFLAGDAAHIHSPFGGRGMNLGIEDAAWLAWLISAGRTESYTADRWPVGRQVLRTVDPATRLMSADSVLPRVLRRNVAPVLFSIPAVRRRAVRRLTALDTPAPPWLSGEHEAGLRRHS